MSARVVSAPLLDLGYRAGRLIGQQRFWADVDGGDELVRYELTANAFGLLAVLVTGPHADVVVLSRKSESGPYDAVGLFTAEEAALVAEKLRGR